MSSGNAIKLFLTSSLMSDMEHDINELGAFVDDLNDRYESNDVYFKLHISAEGDNEDDLNVAENSELFYIIFHDEPEMINERVNSSNTRGDYDFS
jgi:hypothetical protein